MAGQGQLGKSHEFMREWDFPNCIGALDGKHVAIECPGHIGSECYNYKGFYSIVLMAMCDAKYCFKLVDVGNYGKENDAQIFNNSAIGKAFIQKKMNVPDVREVNGYKLPYVIVSDEIFGLQNWLMKPYPGRAQVLPEDQAVFNYRLSRSRRTIKNAFGFLAARWQIFRKPIKAKPTTVDYIVKACLCLHNYLRLTDNAQCLLWGFADSEDGNGTIKAGDWRQIVSTDSSSLHATSTGKSFNRSTSSAKCVCKEFTKYLNSPGGSLSWQKSHVNSFGKKKGYVQYRHCE